VPYDYYEIKALHDQLVVDGIVYEEDRGMSTNYSNPYHTFVPAEGGAPATRRNGHISAIVCEKTAATGAASQKIVQG
jgi:hypothetical protein